MLKLKTILLLWLILISISSTSVIKQKPLPESSNLAPKNMLNCDVLFSETQVSETIVLTRAMISPAHNEMEILFQYKPDNSNNFETIKLVIEAATKTANSSIANQSALNIKMHKHYVQDYKAPSGQKQMEIIINKEDKKLILACPELPDEDDVLYIVGLRAFLLTQGYESYCLNYSYDIFFDEHWLDDAKQAMSVIQHVFGGLTSTFQGDVSLVDAFVEPFDKKLPIQKQESPDPLLSETWIKLNSEILVYNGEGVIFMAQSGAGKTQISHTALAEMPSEWEMASHTISQINLLEQNNLLKLLGRMDKDGHSSNLVYNRLGGIIEIEDKGPIEIKWIVELTEDYCTSYWMGFVFAHTGYMLGSKKGQESFSLLSINPDEFQRNWQQIVKEIANKIRLTTMLNQSL